MSKKGKSVKIIDPKSKSPSPKKEKGKREKPKWLRGSLLPLIPKSAKCLEQ